LKLINTLLAEFPDIVRAWGGEAVLRNRELVGQLAVKMGVAEPPPPEPAAGVPALDEGQRKEILGRVRELYEKVGAANFPERKPFPFLVALLVGVVLGAGAGVGSGFAYVGYRGTAWLRGPNNQMEYFDYRGLELEQPQYIREDRQATAMAVMAGVGGALAVGVFVAVALARRRWYRLPLVWGAALGAALGAPAGAGLVGVRHYLRGPYTTWVQEGGLDQWGRYKQVLVGYDYRGNRLEPIAYQLELRETITTSVLLGVGLALAILIAVLLLVQRWYHAWATRARREAEEEARRLAGDFPQVASAWGGAEALTKGDHVEELVRRLEGGAT
jgi:hypothetical protein